MESSRVQIAGLAFRQQRRLTLAVASSVAPEPGTLSGDLPMTVATKVHPRDPETGQIGQETDADEFVRDYLRENSTLLRYFV